MINVQSLSIRIHLAVKNSDLERELYEDLINDYIAEERLGIRSPPEVLRARRNWTIMSLGL